MDFESFDSFEEVDTLMEELVLRAMSILKDEALSGPSENCNLSDRLSHATFSRALKIDGACWWEAFKGKA